MSDPLARLNAALSGRYRIESELGEGGMATVYLADDIKHERKVALKVLKGASWPPRSSGLGLGRSGASSVPNQESCTSRSPITEERRRTSV